MQKLTPPRWADQLLEWFCAPHLLEEVQGDLYERFQKNVRVFGESIARREYVLGVLGFIKPFALKRKTELSSVSTASKYTQIMISNYFKIAFRNFLKYKGYSFINVLGLAIGMACSLLIGLWVKDEFSYNRYLPDADNIHFVLLNAEENGKTINTDNTPGPLVDVIKKDVPEVMYATKVAYWPFQLVKAGEKKGKEIGYYASDDFFNVFQFAPLAGNPAISLKNLNQVIITRKLADAYFPELAGQYKQILGKRLQLNNEKYYTVGSVVEKFPANSTLRFNWVTNFRNFEQDWMKTWGNTTFRTFVRLNPKATVASTEKTMRGIYPRYTDFGQVIYPILQPIKDVYLYAKFENGKPVGGRIDYVRVFSIVALFILLIACVNFMNLATARATLRTKEIGVRKVIGALRRSLVGQFLSESLLLSLVASLIALLLVVLAMPAFNEIFNKQISISFADPVLWLSILSLIFVTGVLSGYYPALFLSAFQPLHVLKGNSRSITNGRRFRKVLVVFQFSLSVFLIVGMLAVGNQMKYIRTKTLGIDRENVVVIPLEGDLLNKNKEVFRQSLLVLPSIASATTTNELPVNINASSGDVRWPGKPDNKSFDFSANWIGPDFIKTMNIQMLEGRDFRLHSKADSLGYIINETAVKLMGMKNPIGKEITFWHGKAPIIGVMKDFHLQSLHQPIKPLIFVLDNGNASYLLARIKSGQTTQGLADIEKMTKKFNPNYSFDYQFLDEAYGRMYRSEKQVSSLINIFGVLAIFISCLGLFGLAAFTAEQRNKEIGIRKVLGASVANIVSLLSADFMKLVTIALVIASPLAWWALNNWLSTFQYHTQLEWWIFAIAGLLAVGIALLTVSFQSIKAALMNPVKTLKSE